MAPTRWFSPKNHDVQLECAIYDEHESPAAKVVVIGHGAPAHVTECGVRVVPWTFLRHRGMHGYQASMGAHKEGMYGLR